MRAGVDDKMFAPLRRRSDAISVRAMLVAVLGGHPAGTTVAGLADELLRGGLAVGTSGPVRARVGELLEELEQAARVERIPDGRYRAVAAPGGHR